jgi:cell wall-associated NlpC family hydrolase
MTESPPALAEAEARTRVVAEARGWLRTPFHDCANVKGVGVDCANLIAQVFERAGVVPHVEIQPYLPQWFLHKSTELFVGYVLAAGGVEISESEVGLGDIVMYRVGRCFAHGGIVVDWPGEIIHAYKPVGMVAMSDGKNGPLASAPRRYFTMWPRR